MEHFKIIYEVTAFCEANDETEAMQKATTSLKTTKCDLGIIAEIRSIQLWGSSLEEKV